jgi:hypothetical protein
MDGDGQTDLLIAAPMEGHAGLGDPDEALAGAVYLFAGPVIGVDGPDHARARWLGGHRFGELALMEVTDIDGDGFLDLVLSSPSAELDTPGGAHGAVQIVPSAFGMLGL